MSIQDILVLVLGLAAVVAVSVAYQWWCAYLDGEAVRTAGKAPSAMWVLGFLVGAGLLFGAWHIYDTYRRHEADPTSRLVTHRFIDRLYTAVGKEGAAASFAALGLVFIGTSVMLIFYRAPDDPPTAGESPHVRQ